MALDRRLRVWRAVRRERVLGGTGPWKPMPGSRREVTRDRFGLQVTPVQVQTGEESVQLRWREWGRWLERERSASLSSWRREEGEEREGRRESKNRRREIGCGMFIFFFWSVSHSLCVELWNSWLWWVKGFVGFEGSGRRWK